MDNRFISASCDGLSHLTTNCTTNIYLKEFIVMFTSLHFAAGCMAAGTLLLIALRALALENNVEGEPVSLNDQVRRVDGQMRAAAMDLIETVEEMLP